MPEKKRVFQLLDEINQADTENNTANLGLCNSFTGCRSIKGGGEISMGVPMDAMLKVMSNKMVPMLILVESKEFEKIKKALE